MTEFKFLGELPIPLRHTYAILNVFNELQYLMAKTIYKYLNKITLYFMQAIGLCLKIKT